MILTAHHSVDTRAVETDSRSPIGSGVLSAAGSVVATTLLVPFATSATRLRKLLLAIIILDIPLQIGTHLFWSDELGETGGLGGLEISITTVALLGLYFLWFVQYISRREREPLISLRPALPLALYLIFQAVSLLAAHSPLIGVYEVWLTAQMLLLFIYLIKWIRTRHDVEFVIRLLLVGFVLEAGIILTLERGGHNVEIPGLPGHTLMADTTEGEEAFSRPGGTFASPNAAGSYLSIMLTLVVGLLLLARVHAWYAPVTLMAAGMGLIALLLTYSRGGWLGFSSSTLLLCGAGWRLFRLGRKIMMVGALVALFVSLLSDTPLSRRLLESDEGSAHSRIALNKLAIAMIENQPLVGVGVNNFTANVREYATQESMGEWLYTVHNKYLLVWSEAGLGGLLAYLWFLASSLNRGWQCWKCKHAPYSPLALTFLCGIASLMICDLFEPDRGRPLMQLLIVLAAVIGAIHRCTPAAVNGRPAAAVRVKTVSRRRFS